MNQSKAEPEWFKNWFNEDYLTVYAHRTPEAAEAEIIALGSWVDLRGRRILDLGCGSGRHLGALAARAASVCGTDLSAPLLRVAAAERRGAFSLVRADLRALPFSDNAFNFLTCFFTGFGYLASDEEHLRMLREWFRLLEPGGLLLLDCPNKLELVKKLPNETSRREGNTGIVERRRFENGRVEKEIHITSPGAEPRTYTETVRVFSEGELTELVRSAGFSTTRTAADFSGNAFRQDSARLVLLAERST